MVEATAAKPPPDPRDEIRDVLRQAAAEIRGGRLDVQRAIDARGDLLELMALARRLGEFEAAVRAAALLLVAAGQPAVPEAQAPRKHRHRAPAQRSRGALRPVPGVSPARGAAAAAVAVALSTGGLVAGMHEESAVSVVAAVPARHAALPRMVPDAAAPVPVPRLPPRPEAAASARPAPSPSAPGSPSSILPPPVPSLPSAVPSPGVLAADNTVLQLQGATSGTVTLTATGGPVAWSAQQVPGVAVEPASGTLEAGQSEAVTVTALDMSQSGFAIIDLGPGVSLTVSWMAADGGLPGVALPAGL